ncbi:hypothetical protein DFQ14_1084 [Halopolyspora algeriensis]|uniref:Uncharacterized protein n=1 Tax=Halopolyspora algeriensis TaxID=1500506 RepID=A0A368VM24_9ACTN|nr:hypothetical protein DFQ14_1084 [Halopolyspora algeriensis]TQM56781.1 hypothetical protein FHU43_1595 [Halopolyspora algeriensis]
MASDGVSMNDSIVLMPWFLTAALLLGPLVLLQILPSRADDSAHRHR